MRKLFTLIALLGVAAASKNEDMVALV
jgi:hypothetical protein